MKRTCFLAALLVLPIAFIGLASGKAGAAFAGPPTDRKAANGSLWPASSAWPRLQCRYSVYVIVAEVAKQCQAGRDQKFQKELERTVARFETVIQNSDDYFTPKRLAGFKSMQTGGPDPIKCDDAALKLYKDFHRGGTRHLRKKIDALLTPPKGGWGNAPYCVYDLVPAIPLAHVRGPHR